MRDYTTDELLESVKRRAAIALGPGTFDEDKVLAFADDELQSAIVPAVMSLRAEHFATYEDVTTTDELVYEIPESALNRGLKRVCFVDAAGVEQKLTKIDFDAESDEPGQRGTYPNGAFYIQGDSVVLYPNVTAGRTLRMHFYRAPNRLVQTSAAAQVLAVDTDLDTVTCSSVPASWEVGDLVCCVAGRPGFGLRFAAREITVAGSPSFTIDDVTGVEVGDWIALEGDSPIAQIPVEMHPVLAQKVAAKVLEALGDPKTPFSRDEYAAIAKNVVDMAGPRVESAPKRFTGRNRLIDWLRK